MATDLGPGPQYFKKSPKDGLQKQKDGFSYYLKYTQIPTDQLNDL